MTTTSTESESAADGALIARVMGWPEDWEITMYHEHFASCLRRLVREARASGSAAPTAGHSDDAAVDRFAAAMKAKLAVKRREGRGGWDDRETCSNAVLAKMLIEHIPKGDPVDIANFVMMIHQRDAQGIENGTIDNLPGGVRVIAFVAGSAAPAPTARTSLLTEATVAELDLARAYIRDAIHEEMSEDRSVGIFANRGLASGLAAALLLLVGEVDARARAALTRPAADGAAQTPVGASDRAASPEGTAGA